MLSEKMLHCINQLMEAYMGLLIEECSKVCVIISSVQYPCKQLQIYNHLYNFPQNGMNVKLSSHRICCPSIMTMDLTVCGSQLQRYDDLAFCAFDKGSLNNRMFLNMTS